MLTPKLIYGIIYLPMIIGIGLITSYEDFLTSKIRNKWIIIGMLYVLVTYLFAWFMKMIKKFDVINSYLLWNFDKLCINVIISSLVAYGLWRYKKWGAGDAKLFICYSALIPLGQYSKVYFNYYFPSFLLLLYFFVPATVFLIIRSISCFIKKYDFRNVSMDINNKINQIRSRFNLAETGKILLGFFVLILFSRIFINEYQPLFNKFLHNYNVLILVPLLLFTHLTKFFKTNTILMFLILVVLLICVVIGNTLSWKLILEMKQVLAKSLLIIILFPLSRKIIEVYELRTTQKTTPFAPWMLLGALITWFL